jgi:hypothetical protein
MTKAASTHSRGIESLAARLAGESTSPKPRSSASPPFDGFALLQRVDRSAHAGAPGARSGTCRSSDRPYPCTDNVNDLSHNDLCCHRQAPCRWHESGPARNHFSIIIRFLPSARSRVAAVADVRRCDDVRRSPRARLARQLPTRLLWGGPRLFASTRQNCQSIRTHSSARR